MTSILQLQPQIYVQTPLGKGWCFFILEYDLNINTIWLVRLDETGQVKHFDSNDIVIEANPMLHQPKIT